MSATYHIYILLSFIELRREADELRLREVCESFLGPPLVAVADSKNSSWDPSVLVRLHYFGLSNFILEN
jgi:hypothetical protein